jgi:hypothetical protein
MYRYYNYKNKKMRRWGREDVFLSSCHFFLLERTKPTEAPTAYVTMNIIEGNNRPVIEQTISPIIHAIIAMR